MKRLKLFLPYVKKERKFLILSLICAVISSICKLAIPFLTGRAIDQIRGGNTDVSVLLIVMGACIVGGSLFRYLFDYSLSILSQCVVKRLRDDCFRSILEVPVSYIDQHDHGDLLLRLVNDVDNVQNGLIMGAGALFEGIVQVLTTIVFMFYIHWLLGIIVVFLTPISVIVSRFISKSNAKYFKAQNADLGAISSLTLETLRNGDAVRSYSFLCEKEKEFDRLNGNYRRSSFKALYAACWINPMTRLVNNTIYAAVIIFGVCLIVFPGSFTWSGVAFSVGMLSAFLTYSYQYMTPFNEIADASTDVFYALSSLDRINEVLLAPKDVDEGTKEQKGDVSSILGKGVVFSYDGKRNVLDGFSLEIKRGQKIALVGTTGCGKTTTINLLMRFYDPQGGGFFFDGVKTTEIRKGSLRSHIGMVLQDTWLKHGTIRENIAFGKPDAGEEEIIAAAKKAHADEFIRLMPQGYDTPVSSTSGLSTGQKQLLCVARIILMQPEIVFLDEATSNIDLRTELELSSAFDELMGGKTSIVVAHRLSTIRNADVILVMDKGKVVESGTFQSLMEQNGFFAELYRAQFA